jgi:ELWxxDGT repeat protein
MLSISFLNCIDYLLLIKMLRKLPFAFILVFFNHLCSYAQISTLLKDINPGEKSSFVDGKNICISYKGALIFAAKNVEFGHELWIYKDNQTRLLKDIFPGSESSEAQNMYLVNDKVIFSAKTKENGFELWTTDGTTDGTKLLLDANPGIKDGVFVSSISSEDRFLVIKNKLYYTGISETLFLMWETDGTASGTKVVKNMGNIHTFPSDLTEFKGELYFSTSFSGVFKIDAIKNDVVKVMDMETTYSLLATSKYLYALSYDQLWISEGTIATSKKIFTITSPTLNWRGNRLIELNGIVFFPNETLEFGPELWKTDGTTAGTKMVKDVYPGVEGYAPQNYTIFKNKLYYKGENDKSGIELFVSDGTEAGTNIVKDINPGINSSFSLPSTVISDSKRIYFNADDFFTPELWISDGTNTGTRKVKVTSEFDTNDDPDNFYLFDNKLFVYAFSEALGYEPYVVDFVEDPNDLDKDGFTGAKDCDETNPNINAGRAEVPYNGVDDDCNLATPDDDLDKDSFKKDKDCDDKDPSVNPNAKEFPYNGVDDDCNPTTPDDDLDKDGFLIKDDCNDNNKNINPKSKEILGNGIDENCDGKDDPLLGIFNVSDIGLAYPNPSNGEFELSNVELNTIKIYTADKKEVKFVQINQSIKLLENIEGIYFIIGEKKVDKKPITFKIIIQHRKF